MKFYKNINRYLLTNYPLLWKTKVFEMGLLICLFWLTSFAWGYFFTSLKTLQDRSFYDFYEKSWFFSFHFIFTLISVSIWAILFYKNRAFKNFYPISRTYLLKMFGIIFLIFSGFISAYFPFTKGAEMKTEWLVDEENFERDVDILNMASAFIPNGGNQYDIYNKVYPSPFPLHQATYDQNEKKWNGFVYYSEDLNEKDHYSEDFEYREYFPQDSQNITEINGNYYVFFNVKNVYSKKDSCNSKEFISKFHTFDTSKIHLSQNSVLNYSYEFFNFIDKENTVQRNFKSDYAERVHALINNKNFDSIAYFLKEHQKICSKYQVFNSINEVVLLRYLKIKNFEDLNQIVFEKDEYRGGIIYSNAYYDKLDDIDFISKLEYQNSSGEILSSSTFFEFGSYELKQVLENLSDVRADSETHRNYKEMFLITLFLSAIFAYIFFLFEFTNMISFLISIPVIGVLIILTTILDFTLRYSYNYYEGGGSYSLMIYFAVVLLLVLLHFLFLFSKWTNKRILDISLNVFSFVAPLFFPYLVGTIYFANQSHYYGKCGDFVKVELFSEFFISPIMLFVYGLIGIVGFILLLKKWIAKEE